MRVPVTSSLLQSVNATPMLDVMLVLLVIFMVVTPLVHSDPGLELPHGFNLESTDADSGLTIRLSITGELSLTGSHVASRSGSTG
jgi:biopolymer transport protein ExbD